MISYLYLVKDNFHYQEDCYERKSFGQQEKWYGNDGAVYSALCRGRSRCNIRRSLRKDSPYGHRYHLGFTWMDPVPWP